MSRLSFRPRPLDIHKKLPIVKSVKEFEDDDGPGSTRNSHLIRLATAETENEVHHIPTKKLASEIPTPQFVDVDSYEWDYSCTFAQTNSYLRSRGARAEIGEFVEYDLDNEDEDWLHELNDEDPDNRIPPEKVESILFKLEVLDHKARERAGIVAPTLGSPVPVILQLDAAFEALQSQVQPLHYDIFQNVYNYWKEKRVRWQKPILRRLQPPPLVNDTNPYNVFRPREKAHRLHTRRMQRRENNVQSFEKLRQVRRNLDQAKTMLEALIKREEKKREVLETEISLQRIQMKFKHETELLEDSLAFPGFPPISSKFASSEDEFGESDEPPSTRPRGRPPAVHNHPFTDANVPSAAHTVTVKQESRRRKTPHGWLNKLDPLEPVMLFTKPLIPDKLAAAGIVPPVESPMKSGSSAPHRFHGRIGRGGRIVFDRWNPLLQTPIDVGNSYYMSPRPRTSSFN